MDATVEALAAWPGDFTLLVGAGVSMRAPTCLPSGPQLSEAALQASSGRLVRDMKRFMQSKVALAEVFGVYVGGGQSTLRPEAVFEAYQRICGDDAVSALDFLSKAYPNVNHCVLAELAARGAAIVTTNFDTLIEDCGARQVLHLHGHIGDLSTICGTIRTITQPLPDPLRQDLWRRLSARPRLAVLGYSGGDVFDVTAALETLPEQPDLTWFQHGHPNTPLDRGAKRLMAQWRVSARCVTGNTDHLFDELAVHFGISPSNAKGGGPAWWRSLLRQRLRSLLPAGRNRLLGALSVLELLHSGRFVPYYLYLMLGPGAREKARTIELPQSRQTLVLKRALARRESSRGDYRASVAITKQTARWLRRRGNGSGSDIAEQYLLLVLNIRNFGQRNPLQYVRSLWPLLRASIAARHASPPYPLWLERTEAHIRTEWVQFWWVLHRKRYAREARLELLKAHVWDAEHYARLLVSDDEGRRSQEAMEFNFDLEGTSGFENTARALLRHELPCLPLGVSEDRSHKLLVASRAYGDVVGYAKSLMTEAARVAPVRPDEAARLCKKSRWILRRVTASSLTRLSWRIELAKLRLRRVTQRVPRAAP